MARRIALGIERGLVQRARLPPLAYSRLAGDRSPGILFLSGFLGTKAGIKVSKVMEHCAGTGHPVVAFDYTDKGDSVHTCGNYEPQWSFDQWLDDARTALSQLAHAGPNIVIGSSMGALLAALLARDNAHRVAGFISIAFAGHFHERAQRAANELTLEMRRDYDNGQVVTVPRGGGLRPWPVSKRLVAESSNVAYRVLASHSPQLPITAPCRLLHAVDDQLVPYDLSVRLMRKLQSDDVTLTLRKDADHAMSDTASVQLLIARVDELLALCASKSRS